MQQEGVHCSRELRRNQRFLYRRYDEDGGRLPRPLRQARGSNMTWLMSNMRAFDHRQLLQHIQRQFPRRWDAGGGRPPRHG